ncbi:hypothetical protein [Mycobacterium sp. C31M]
MPAFLLLIAALAAGTLLLLRAPVAPHVAETVPGELQGAANRVATQYLATTDRLVQTAENDRAAIAAKRRGALLRLSRANPDIDGLALIDTASRAVLTKRGDTVAIPPALPSEQDGAVAAVVDDELVIAVAVSPQRTLVGSSPARPPAAAPGQRVLITRADGAVLAESTGRPVVPSTITQSVAMTAARGETDFAVDDSRLAGAANRGILAIPNRSDAPDHVVAVGAAPIRDGLSVLVGGEVPVTSAETVNPGRAAAVAVALGGLAAAALLYLLLVRPVRRLRADVDGAVADVDDGRMPTGRIRRSRLRQVDRISGAMIGVLPTAEGHLGDRHKITVPGTGLILAAGAVFVTALTVAFAGVGVHESARTDTLTERSRVTVEDTADSLENAMATGLAAVQATAVPKVGDVRDDWSAATAVLRAQRPVFRSVYVRADTGEIVAAAGEAPLAEVIPPAALAQLNTSGPQPIVTAAERTPDGKFTVVGEYDVRALNDILRRADSPTAVYDGGARTVLGSDGYVSFSELDEPALRRVAAESGLAPRADVQSVAGTDQLVAAQRLGQTEVTAALGWTVLQHREVTVARYTVDPIGRAVTVIVGAAALLVLGLLCWSYLAIIRPLGSTERWLTDIAANPRRARPAGPPPRRLDEVGAVMAGLDHCVNRGERR